MTGTMDKVVCKNLPSSFTNLYLVLVLVLLSGLLGIVTAQRDELLSEEVAVFQDFTQWNGGYVYKYTTYPCEMKVKSVSNVTGIVIVELKDAEAEMELKGGMYSGYRILLTKTSLSRPSAHFPVGKDFQMAGKLTRKSLYYGWVFNGNVTSPVNSSFLGFKFHSDNGLILTSTPSPSNYGLRIGITVGVSLICALIGVALMVSLIVWAVRKGYLRHVPSSYDSLENLDKKSYDAKSGSLHI